MMLLNTVPVPSEMDTITVYWSTGYRNNGAVEVKIPVEREDRIIIAELIAIRHLIFTQEVFGQKPTSGNGYELRVSSGAIRKLMMRRSTKEHLLEFALFLSGPLEGVTITVCKHNLTDKLFGSLETHKLDTVNIANFENQLPQEKWNTSIGQLYISKHAVQQYEIRLNEQNKDPVSNPMNSLLRALNQGPFIPVELAEDVANRKKKKYGDNHDVETWKNPYTGLNLTVSKNTPDGTGLLLTCFYRTSSFREK